MLKPSMITLLSGILTESHGTVEEARTGIVQLVVPILPPPKPKQGSGVNGAMCVYQSCQHNIGPQKDEQR
jgi:hypothetical protein